MAAEGAGAGEGEEGAEGAGAPKEDPSFYQRREGEGSSDYAARIFRCVGRP
jgi:hypothetical protein